MRAQLGSVASAGEPPVELGGGGVSALHDLLDSALLHDLPASALLDDHERMASRITEPEHRGNRVAGTHDLGVHVDATRPELRVGQVDVGRVQSDPGLCSAGAEDPDRRWR